MIYWDNQHLKQHAVHNAKMIANVLSQQFIKIVLMDSADAATDIVDALNPLTHVLNAYVYDMDNTVVFRFTQKNTEPIPVPQLNNLEASVFDGDFLHLTIPLNYQGMSFATLYLRLSTDDINAWVTRHIISYSLLFPLVAVLAVLLSYWLQHIISKPILQLAHVIGRASKEQDFSLRAHSSEKNEIDKLSQDFNALLETVQLANTRRDTAEHELMQAHDQLEEKVEERTQALKASQHQLVQSEKMAALGGLVAGVAHEINTPVGVGVTAASHLNDELILIEQHFLDNTLGKRDLQAFLTSGQETCDVLLKNMLRASDLVKSFKQVAVDQSCGEKRTFDLKEYLREILLSLHPITKKTPHQIHLYCPDHLEITSYPGAISQIITNFITNSLVHGFPDNTAGNIQIDITQDKQHVHLHYRDNGIGIPKAKIMKIYEPFFTTNRGSGSTGLGMHIVSGLVLNTLQGSIICNSDVGAGVLFQIEFPISV